MVAAGGLGQASETAATWQPWQRRQARRRRAVVVVSTLVVAACLCGTGTSLDFVTGMSRRCGLQTATASSELSRSPTVFRRFFEPFKLSEPPVIIKEDYTLAAIFVTASAVLILALPFFGFGVGLIFLLLGLLFFIQTGRVRFVFDEDAFEVKALADTGMDLESAGQNFAVGGENRWTYGSFVNWEFFPKGFVERGWPPVLVYFKETQTPREQWTFGPGQLANSEEAMAKGAVPGMVHFFPCICDAQQIKAEFEKRGCKKLANNQ